MSTSKTSTKSKPSKRKGKHKETNLVPTPSTSQASTKKPSASGSGSQPAAEPRFEGKDTSLDYQPPKGFVLAEHEDIDDDEFDWDALRAGGEEGDLEMWVMRVPEGIKLRHLESLSLGLCSSSHTARLGSFERRSTQYEVWNIGEDSPDHIGGEELKSLQCLVPRKKKSGKLYIVPPSLPTRHIVISASPALPTPPSSLPSPEAASEVDGQTEGGNHVVTRTKYMNPPRHSYPLEAFKHRFMPVGSLVGSTFQHIETNHVGRDGSGMEVDATVAVMSGSEDGAAPSQETNTKGKRKTRIKVSEEPVGKSKKRKASMSGEVPGIVEETRTSPIGTRRSKKAKKVS